MSSSSSSGRRRGVAAAASPGQKRARDDDPSSKPPSASAKNPRRVFSSSPFADFGSYMAAKNSKLAAQFNADAAAAPGALFAGVSIFVDGFTVPSSQELKEIMLNNGGRFVNYFSRHTVTHIICTHLADSKMKNMSSFSKGLPVVKPAWVVDSLAENRLLSCIPYQISQQTSSSRKQMKLSAFFSEKQIGKHQGEPSDENKDLECQTSSAQEGSLGQNGSCDREGSSLNVEVAQDSLSPDVQEPSAYDEQEVAEDSLSPDEPEALKYKEQEVAEDSLSPDEQETSKLEQQDVAEDSLSPDEQEASTFEERDSGDFGTDEDDNACEKACAEDVDNDMNVKVCVAQSPDAKSRCSNVCSTSSIASHQSFGSLEKNTAKSSSRPHSTLTDPNFVENYFKYSRLHFIGTWRNRYRKRFSNLLGAKRSKGNNDHSSQKKTIVHIDMDCFFVSVVIRNMPELHDKPVAVCHSDNPKGTAEISSANYPARNYGIKASMFVRDAKARCPHIMVVPYNFDAYGEVADQFYGILHKYCSNVQALSCDEAFLDMTECLHDNPEEVVQRIRSEIFGTTKCTASAGISENMLLARLATRSAKPNGQCFISSEKVDDYLNILPIKALPGIGYTVSARLKSKDVECCGQLRNIPKDALHKDFGKKIGDMLWNYCRGIDHSVVEAVQETKSVGAEVNWGVRFNDIKDAENFLVNLSKEVYLRLQGCGVQGRTITLKVKTRRKGAGEPVKFMGCGDCETMSRSTTIAGATDNLLTLQRIARQLFVAFRVDVKEVRGIGLKMSKLEHADLSRGALQGNMLKSWLGSSSEKLKKQRTEKTCLFGNDDGAAPQGNMLNSWLGSSSEKVKKQRSEKTCLFGNNDGAGTSKMQHLGNSRPSSEGLACHPSEMNVPSDRSTRANSVELPPLSQLDVEVIKNLPPDIISEMNDMYKGKLHGFLNMTNGDKGKERYPKSLVLPAVTRRSAPVRDVKLHKYEGCNDSMHLEKEKVIKGASDKQLSEVRTNDASCPRASGMVDAKSVRRLDYMPNSLSQVDFTVLQELPEDVKADLFNVLPLHRSRDPTCSTSENKCSNDGRTDDPKHPVISLLPGSSKKWTEQFRVSSCLLLNVIAEQGTDSICNKPLSSILEHMVSFLPLCPNPGTEEWNETFSCLSKLLTQYIHLKVESDIEELHKCFRLLKRFSSSSVFFLELHNSVLPVLQDSVGQHYGGTLLL